MKPLTFGILSTASITSRFIQAVQNTKHCEVSAIASRNQQKAKEMAENLHIPHSYGSYLELYQDSEVDIIYIATNNGSHIQNIKDALTHGKHVLCEKPLALSHEDAAEVFALAKEKKLFLMEAQKSVFLPITHKIKEYITQQKLGVLKQVILTSSFDSPKASWMHEKQQGGVVYGSASYSIEYLDFLIEPAQTLVTALGTREATQAVDAINMSIRMDDVLISSYITMRNSCDNRAIFYFEKGSIEVKDYWKARACTITQGQDSSELQHPVDFEMIYEIEHVAECIRNKKVNSDIMSKERTLACARIVDEIMNTTRF